MKKRMLAALLAGSMLLTACGGTGDVYKRQALQLVIPFSPAADSMALSLT